MKSSMKIPMLVVVMALLLVGNAMAFPWIEVEGFVDPFSATITDNQDGTSLVQGLNYRFTVTNDGNTGAEMNRLSLEFEDDVFFSVSNAYGYDPDDWSSTTADSGTSMYTVLFAGTTIGVGESLQFSVDVVMNNEALTDASLWDEGQIWGQSWNAYDTMLGGDGGSTAPVPEPATMLLLGTGLAGIATVGRRKAKKA